MDIKGDTSITKTARHDIGDNWMNEIGQSMNQIYLIYRSNIIVNII